MSEIGLDIANLRSKSIDEFVNSEFDYVVTVCDSLQALCPAFPGKGEQIHKSFEDPAEAEGSEDKILYEFRKSRNEIKSWIIRTFGPNGGR
jgi:arsenate reductase